MGYYIIISTTEKHGLEEYQPPPPRVTIWFHRGTEQWFIGYAHYSFRPPERELAIDSETALDALCSSLVDLWKETHPDEHLPESLAKQVHTAKQTTLVPTKYGMLFALSQSDKTEFGKDVFNAQSVPQKVFSSIWSLQENLSGGSRYIFNSPETAGFVVDALKIVGALQTAKLCKHAIGAAFPFGLPADLGLIPSIVEDFSRETEARLSELDDQFDQHPDDLTELLYKYVSTHPEEFGELPDPTLE